jgi:acetyl esterase
MGAKTVDADAYDFDPRLSDPDAALLVARLNSAAATQPTAQAIGIHATRGRSRHVRLPGDDRVTSHDVDVPTPDGMRRARIYSPTGASIATMLFLHGGGWVVGDLDTNDGLCRELAARAAVTLVSLDYRLAPEHPYPAALDDATAALHWLAAGADDLVDQGLPLVVGGHSAGGNLAAALARRGRDGLAPRVAHQVLLCPVLDHDLDRVSYLENESGLLLTRDDMRWYWELYTPDESRRSEPDASPLRVPDAEGLPSATIVAGGADPLRDEALAYAELLELADVPVTFVLQPGVPHLFLTFAEVRSRAEVLDKVGVSLAAALT